MLNDLNKYIDQYKQYFKEGRLDSISFEDQESKQAFNEDIARETFGDELIEQLIKRNKKWRIFTGDWWSYALLNIIFHRNDCGLPERETDEWNLFWFEVVRAEIKTVIHLESADLFNLNLSNTKLTCAHFENASFNRSKIIRTEFYDCHFNKTKLSDTDLSKAVFDNCKFNSSDFGKSLLRKTKFYSCNIFASAFRDAGMFNAVFYCTNLQNCIFERAYLYGTQFELVELSKYTNFTGSFIDSRTLFIKTDPNQVEDRKIRSGLNYCTRRYNWEQSYDTVIGIKVLPPLFWHISDYGYSTKRIINSFLCLAVGFAVIYWFAGAIPIWSGVDHAEAGFVENLFCVAGHPVGWFDSICRSIYFSIVTMTTLGFGDIYAKPDCFWGYFFLTAQVILGYVLLGVLITRLAVLFNSDGPTYRPPESPNHPKFWPQFWTELKALPSFWKSLFDTLLKKKPQIEKAEL